MKDRIDGRAHAVLGIAIVDDGAGYWVVQTLIGTGLASAIA